jgi:exo-beta-1,3-glucanase (GH17 family)
VDKTRNAVNSVSPGTWVWVTETGWPVSGPDSGAAQASQANAQTYWNNVACNAMQSMHFFWYAYQDYNESPSFGIFGGNGQAVYSTACS